MALVNRTGSAAAPPASPGAAVPPGSPPAPPPPAAELPALRASSPGPSAHAGRYEIEFQCYDGQNEWLLSLPLLQLMGFQFLYGNPKKEGAFVYTPAGYSYPLERGARGNLWGMRCHCPERGRLVYGDGPGQAVMVTVDVDLLVDSCAMLHCGGRGANLILIPSSGPGRNAVGAGGHPLVSKMHGWVTLEFPPPGAHGGGPGFASPRRMRPSIAQS